MTRKEWAKLTPKEQRIKVAELCGWTRIHKLRACSAHDGLVGVPKPRTNLQAIELKLMGELRHVPDYLNDLNAMREVVETLRDRDDSTWFDFGHCLKEICGSTMNCIQATASQRAEAFVLTMDREAA